MPTGWTEYLEKFKRQMAAGEPTDPHALWSEFLQQSKTSPRAEALQLFAQIVQKAPIAQRLTVAALLTSLLEPLEWPPEWEQHRPQLLGALELLLTAVSPMKPDSLSTQLGLTLDGNALLSGGVFILSSAAQLLFTSRRDQLHTVAGLCDVGLHQLVVALRHAFARRAKQPMGEALLQARIRFDAALERYAQAARALNSATGEVLFTNLDMRLGGPET